MKAPSKILCPVDFSESSRAALREAVDLAERFDGTVDVVYVWELPLSLDPDIMVIGARGEQSLSLLIEADARSRLDALVRELPEKARARVATHAVWGTPTQTILSKAHEYGADLVVIGTRGRDGLSHFLLGSVAERIMRASPCPVLIVRSALRRPVTRSPVIRAPIT